ncbi:MAG: NAD-dependent epimerase/dehydratase family protein [Steroidobacteraceae bacterium]
MKRREILSSGIALAAITSLPALSATGTSARKPLDILILGGTRFLGLHMTAYAQSRGHRVTFFNRGKTNTSRFPEVERLMGDRNGDISALRGRRWDVVIDNSGYIPRQVSATAELLHETTSLYVFISTVSVYAGFDKPGDENSPIGTLADPTIEKVDGATYGPLKALCEQAARRIYGDGRSLIVRPGLIVGPDDNTDRFTYWPARAARGGRFVAPGDPSDPVQFIDARDLAAFTVESAENSLSGTFNALSPPGRFSIGDVINASVQSAKTTASVDAEPVWIPSSVLDEQKVAPWSDMPVWVPSEGDSAGFAAVSASRAVSAGLRIRPILATTTDTLRWHLSRPEAEQAKLRAGISPEREQDVLRYWASKKGD